MARGKCFEKFKDPRWQKMRLKILDRDNWFCQQCGDNESPLNIHHRYYLPNKDPWEYPEEALITLCESCHLNETESRESIEKCLIFELRKKFLSSPIINISATIKDMPLLHIPELITRVIYWSFTNSEIQQELIDRYIEDCRKKDEEKHREGSK